MSVYIKGMEMPTNAEGCEVIIRIQPNGEVLDLHGFHIGATAIPVPDHGDLIERDSLPWYLKDVTEILEAPTIIPADKEKTNEN